MKEFSIPLQEMFQKGLRQDPKLQRNKQFLIQSQYHKPSPYGSIPVERIINPFLSNQFISWRTPQFFIDGNIALLVFEDEIHSIDITQLPWVTTELSLYDFESPTESKEILTGSKWKFISTGNFWMLVNGASVCFKPNHLRMFGNDDKVFVHDMTIQSGCYHKGRVLLGGFDSNDFYSDKWKSVLENIRLALPVAFAEQDAPGENFVWWSSIGGGDVLNLFNPSIAESGFIPTNEDFDLTSALWFEMMQKNESGFMPMIHSTAIIDMIPLQDSVVVYGNKDISFLYPTQGVMGMIEGNKIDIKAAGGIQSNHIFIAETGNVYSISADKTINLLGYKEFFSSMEDIEILYNSNEEEFIINGLVDDEPKAYVLSSAGLGEYPQVCTSIYCNSIATYGIFDYVDYSIKSDDQVIPSTIISNVIDFGIRDLKTITFISLEGNYDDTTTISVLYRYDTTSDWEETDKILISSEGFVYVGITAVEFKIVISSEDYTALTIEEVTLRVKVTGKRLIRGLYDTSATS